MGIPILKGREFDETDVREGRKVAIVDEVLARKYWPGQDPVGKRVGRGGGPAGPEWWDVIGWWARDAEQSQGRRAHSALPAPSPSRPRVSSASPSAPGRAHGPGAGGPPAGASIDPQQPIYDVRAMEERVSGPSSQPRFLSLLLGPSRRWRRPWPRWGSTE